MLINLEDSVLIHNFENELPNLEFIPYTDHADIKANLSKLSAYRKVKSRSIYNSRFTRTAAASWLWQYLFKTSLRHITPNMRGCNELIEYYRQYTHYENVLFAVDDNHRDHIIHSIWVMLIGFYLQKNCRPFRKPSCLVFDFVGDAPTVPKGLKIVERLFYMFEPALWLLIALTHDLGYPIEKTRMANLEMTKMIENFGFLTQTKFSYQFTILQQTAIDALLNTLSSNLVWVTDDKYRIGIDSGLRLDYAKSFERLDHGIMSSYLLQKNLDFICEKMATPGVPEYFFIDEEDAVKQALIIVWLSAIADHTNHSRYWDELDDMSVLLLLADELDEFSRYSHKQSTDSWTNVKCSTHFHCTGHSIEFTFHFSKNTSLDVESFLRGKIHALIDRFELSEYEIKKLSITCIDNQRGRNSRYYYEKRFDGPSDGTLRKSYAGSTDDIRGFLQGTFQFDHS